MKRIVTLALVAGLVGAGLAAVPAQAKKAKPVKVTLYAHGTMPAGEAEAADGLSGIFMKMDTTEPAAGAPKSMGVTNAAATPNPNCAGNPLFPVWVGDVAGTIKGDIKFTFDVISSPGQVEVRVWPDIMASSCNESYPDAQGQVIVDLPPGAGKVEAVMKNVNFPATAKLMVQISPVQPGAAQARVLYDSPEFPAQLTFTCIPASGSSCTP